MYYYDINIPSPHGYTCQKRSFSSRYDSSVHWHGFIELELFTSGGGYQQYDNKTVPITPGDVWLYSFYDSHKVTLDAGTKTIHLALTPEILHENFLSRLSLVHPLHCSLSRTEIDDFYEKADILCYEQEHQELFSRIKAMSVINELLVDIFRKSLSENIPTNDPLYCNMAEYLQNNFKENISLSTLAHTFGLTSNYCGRLFKKTFGIAFNEYLNTVRLKNACKLLISSDLTIEQIADDSGFHSLEYFYSVFKKFYGVTPAKYRSLSI